MVAFSKVQRLAEKRTFIIKWKWQIINYMFKVVINNESNCILYN